MLNIQSLNILGFACEVSLKTGISPEPALLGFLRDGPMHGYDLHKQVITQLGPVWHLGLSQMYAILKEYEMRGWLESIMLPQAGRPARKNLRLTPAGERAFQEWMNQTAHGLREFRVDFLARLYFARAAGRPALRAFLVNQTRATRRELEALRRSQPASEFAAAVTGFRIAQLQTICDWLTVLRADDRPLRSFPARRVRQPKTVPPR